MARASRHCAFLDYIGHPGIGWPGDTETKMRRKLNQQQAQRESRLHQAVKVDAWLLIPVLLLVSAGLVMVGSSSIAIAESHGVSSFHYFIRHVVYILMG